MPPTNVTLEKDIALLNENKKEKIADREVEKIQSNISELSAKIAAAFLAEKNKNSKTRTSPSSTFGNILTQLTKFVTLSPKNPEAESQLLQNRKILDVLQSKYYSLLRDDKAPVSAHQQRVMAEVADKISVWVKAISREADRKLVENRTLRTIVEEAAAEVEAQTAIIDAPKRSETRKSILRTQSEPVSPKKIGLHGGLLTPIPETTVSSVDDVYDWANWMVDAMATAEEWRSWIQKTVEQTKTMQDDVQPTSQAYWARWKDHVADEAVQLIRRKREIQDTAPSWAKQCCETMVAHDFALNSVATHARSVSRGADTQVTIVESEERSRKTAAKSAARPTTLASQNATSSRLSGLSLVPPSPRPSSRQSLVSPGSNELPATKRQSSKQHVAPKDSPTIHNLASHVARHNIPAAKREVSAIVSGPSQRQSVSASRKDDIAGASRKDDIAGASRKDDIAGASTRQHAPVRKREDSPMTSGMSQRQTVSAPKRDVSPIVSDANQRSNVPAPKRDVSAIASEASPRQNESGAASRNQSMNTPRKSVLPTTPSPSPPQSTKPQPKPNPAKSVAPPTNSPAPKPKKPEAAVNAAPITKLVVRPKDNERRSIYATEFTRKKTVAAAKNSKPVAAPKMSSISNPTGSFCFAPLPKVRRPRSPYSVPQPKCPVHLKDGKGAQGHGLGGKPGGQSPRRISPPRGYEGKDVGKAMAKGKEANEKGATGPPRFEGPRISVRTKQDVAVMNAGHVPAKRLQK